MRTLAILCLSLFPSLAFAQDYNSYQQQEIDEQNAQMQSEMEQRAAMDYMNQVNAEQQQQAMQQQMEMQDREMQQQQQEMNNNDIFVRPAFGDGGAP